MKNKGVVTSSRRSRSYKLSIAAALASPGEIEVYPPFLSCCAGIGSHTDEVFFSEWSSFLVLRNDGCRVWQAGGYRGSPKVGEIFSLNIHRSHGVRGGRGNQLVTCLYTDGDTQAESLKNLYAVCDGFSDPYFDEQIAAGRELPASDVSTASISPIDFSSRQHQSDAGGLGSEAPEAQQPVPAAPETQADYLARRRAQVERNLARNLSLTCGTTRECYDEYEADMAEIDQEEQE